MTQTPSDALAQGVLFALDRDRAKLMFGARELAALQATVLEFLATDALWSEQSILTLEHRGTAIQRALDASPVSDPDTRPALAQALTGGRPLADEATWHAYVVRPDLVPHVADALAQLDVAEFQQVLMSLNSDAAGGRAVELFEELRAFYRRAAEQRCAVAYCIGQ